MATSSHMRSLGRGGVGVCVGGVGGWVRGGGRGDKDDVKSVKVVTMVHITNEDSWWGVGMLEEISFMCTERMLREY